MTFIVVSKEIYLLMAYIYHALLSDSIFCVFVCKKPLQRKTLQSFWKWADVNDLNKPKASLTFLATLL